MARSVYADPFGSYIQGYDTGAQREMALQQGTRNARGMDWDFYNMKPLELETAQRQNAFQQYADPYQRQMLPIGLRNAQNAGFLNNLQAAEPLAWLGLTEPFTNAVRQYTGYGSTGTPGSTQFIDPATGMPVGPVVNQDIIAPWYWRDEYRQADQFNRNLGLQMTELQQKAQQQQLMADQEARLWQQQMQSQPQMMQNMAQEWFGGWAAPQQTAPRPQGATGLEQYGVSP